MAVSRTKEKMNADFPNMEFKAKEYCQLSEMDVLEKHNAKADGVFPYYAQKLHVSLSSCGCKFSEAGFSDFHYADARRNWRSASNANIHEQPAASSEGGACAY